MSLHDNITDPELRAALMADDDLENGGMHADDRQTCHGCQAWATDDHFNGEQHRGLMMGDWSLLWRAAS